MRFAFTVLAALAVTCACGSPSDAEEQGALRDPKVRATLRELGFQASSNSGVAMPRTMVAVASSDHQVAEEIASGGSIVNDHAPVYVVMMTGGPFTSRGSRPTEEVPAPQGNVITLTVDARTFDGLDFGLRADAPDLTLISPDVVDLLAAQ